jgi:hypothetical protein
MKLAGARLVTLWLAATLWPVAGLAQSEGTARKPPEQPAPPKPGSPSGGTESSPTVPSVVDVERVRERLEHPSTGLVESTKTMKLDDSTYQVTVTERAFDVWSYWGEKENEVGSNVRSWYFSNWHHEFLRMVTPEYGRRAALYPMGVPAGPIVGAVREWARERARRKAQEEVMKALEEFFREHPEARNYK